MNLRTNIPVLINEGVSSNKNIVVVGRLLQETIIIQYGMNIVFQYVYEDVNGVSLFTKSFNVSIEEQQQLYQAVKLGLPSIDLDFSQWYKELIFQGFRIEMARTFNVELTDITIEPDVVV